MPPEHHLTTQALTGDVYECGRLGPGPRRGGTKSSLLHASTRLGARISTIQTARDFKIYVKWRDDDGSVFWGCESPCLTDRCEMVEGMRARAHTHTHTHTHSHTHTRTHTHTHTHTHNTHCHAHTHTHTHTHTCISTHKAHTSCQFTAQKASPTFQHCLRCSPLLVLHFTTFTWKRGPRWQEPYTYIHIWCMYCNFGREITEHANVRSNMVYISGSGQPYPFHVATMNCWRCGYGKKRVDLPMVCNKKRWCVISNVLACQWCVHAATMNCWCCGYGKKHFGLPLVCKSSHVHLSILCEWFPLLGSSTCVIISKL